MSEEITQDDKQFDTCRVCGIKYEVESAELTHRREKLAVANRYIDLVSRTDKFSGRDFGNHPWKITRLVDKWIVTVKCRNISQAVNDPLEALAIIDSKDVLKEGE